MEPDSPAQLDAFTVLERDKHLRLLQRSAKGLGWLGWPLRVLQLAAIVGGLVVCRVGATTIVLAVVALFVLWGEVYSLEQRMDAIVDLLDLQRTGGSPQS